MSGEFIGEVNVPEPAENEVRITYTVDGDVYSSFIVKKDADAATISFEEPAKPSVSGYTFNGWKYGKSNVKVRNGVVTLTLLVTRAVSFLTSLMADGTPMPSTGRQAIIL